MQYDNDIFIMTIKMYYVYLQIYIYTKIYIYIYIYICTVSGSIIFHGTAVFFL